MAKAENPALETNKALKVLKVILYALLAMPLLIWSVFLFPFITTKVLYFRLLVEVALAIYIPLALKFPELRPKFNLLAKAVWLYVGAVIVTSIFGVDFAHSFWSTVERGEGIITLLHFAVYFTLLPAVFRSEKDWLNYLFGAVIVTAISSLYGVAQLLNLPFVVQPGITRISSTIGNASFFAAFLIFGIFLSIYLLPRARQVWQKPVLWTVLIFEAFVFLAAETRGAALAMLASLLLYLSFNLFTARRKIRIASGIALGAMIVFTAAVYFHPAYLAPVAKRLHIVERLTSISTSDITTQSRLDTWRASWAAWQDRFFTGYGYENYNIAFNKYFPARIFKDAGSQIWFDRAHNVILDVGVTSGIIGLVCYLLIFANAFAALFKRFAETKVLLLLLVAYFLQNLFVFDTQVTHLMFFMMLAYIAHLDTERVPARDSPRAYPLELRTAFTVFAACALAGLAIFANFEPAIANYQVTQGIKSAKLGDASDFSGYFQKSLAHGTYMDQEIRQRLADYTLSLNAPDPDTRRRLVQYAISETRKSIKESPLDAKNYLYLMHLLNETGQSQEVLAIGEQALKLSPTRQHIYFALGQGAFGEGDDERALGYFRKALELNPEPKEPHFNLILAALLAKREDIAAEQKLELEKRGYKLTANDYLSIATAYYRTGDKAAAIPVYREVLARDPDNKTHHASLATIYAEMCDLPNVRSEVEAVVRLDASFQKDAETFLAAVEKQCQQ